MTRPASAEPKPLADRTCVRATLCFGLLGVIALALVVRLFCLQVVGAETVPVERQRLRTERWAAPRGTILDRHGALLAYDRPVFDVRAEAHATLTEGQETAELAQWARTLAADLAIALQVESGGRDARARDRDRQTLEQRILRAAKAVDRQWTLRPGQRGKPALFRRHVDFLVASAVDSGPVLERLDQFDQRRSWLHLHYQRSWERTYPDPNLTLGAIGFVGEQKVATGTTRPVLRAVERLAGLQPHGTGKRVVWQDSLAQRYWTADVDPPPVPSVLETTLDLDLQRAAHDELELAAGAAEAAYKSPLDWGALCLAEIATGDVLAMASWNGDAHPAAAAFAPTQYLCPPGSVVKPLVFSLALERGLLDWDRDLFDCRPNDGDGWIVPHSRRRIHDTHACGVLPPRDILVQSSNIGAVQVGLRLGREGIEHYLQRYAFGTKTGLRWPGELAGVRPRQLASMSDLTFFAYTAPSLSIGYEYNITPVQLLRAYVTLLSRRERELRLFRRVAHGDVVEQVPPGRAGEVFLSEATLQRLIEGMRGVVSDEPGATGGPLYRALRELGPVTVAGKTGTSEYHEARKGETVMVRTSSFAGFAPIEQPRFVAVCILQKAGASSFWGGRYAAPAAGRLLRHALSWPNAKAPPQVSVAAHERRASSGLAAVGRQ